MIACKCLAQRLACVIARAQRGTSRIQQVCVTPRLEDAVVIR